MTQPYIGMIAAFAFGFDPPGWEFCRGQLLSISENDALFALLGTTFGGDGVTTFGVPDLRGRVAIGKGTQLGITYALGQVIGSETAMLTAQNLPSHNHLIMATTEAGDTSAPTGAYLANTLVIDKEYKTDPTTLITMNTGMVSPAGGNPTPFPIVQPVLAINYCIATYGVWPSQQ